MEQNDRQYTERDSLLMYKQAREILEDIKMQRHTPLSESIPSLLRTDLEQETENLKTSK